ncbi:MAG: PAS domain-containing protein [Methyloglobulus sp.]|nr:PAS domain-containing protein [Methyloglobulus sp.]
MRRHNISSLKLLASVLIPILAALLQWELWPTLSPKTWIFFYPAVFFSASIGGLLGGFIATCFAVMLGVYFFIPPQFAWAISDSGHALSIAIFTSMGLSFSLLFEHLHRSTRELQHLKDLELGKEQKRLSLALHAANAGIWEWDPATNHNQWSDSVWRLYGIEPNSCQPSYESWLASVNPDDHITVETIINRALERQAELNLEWRVANLNNDNVRWLMARGVPEFNPKGELLLYRGVVIDITERKKNEKRVQQNEERLNFALETLQAGAWELDLNTLAAQRTILHDQIFGYPELLAEWTYPLFLEHVLPEDKARVDACYRTALDNKTDWSFVCRIRRIDGDIRWISAKGRFSCNELKQATFCRGIVQDITESKLNELALKELSQQLQMALQITNMGVWRVDIQRDLISTIQPGRSISGLPEDIRPKNKREFNALLHPDDRQAVAERLQHSITSEETYEAEFRIVLPNQNIRWVSARGQCQYDNNGKPLVMLGVDLDITDNKNLQFEKQRWADAFINCAHGIVIGDPYTQSIITCNPAFARMLGYTSPKEIEGMAILSLYHPERAEQIKAHIEEADRLGHVRFESFYQRKDGSGIDIQLDLVSVKNSDNKILYRVATVQDITDRKQAKKELQQLNTELEQRVEMRTEELATLNQSLESFVYSVSHDLKTPLRGIEGYSRLLRQDYDEKLDGEGRLFLHNISEGIKRMNDLIDDLLAYSRMSRQKLDNEPVSINQLLDNILVERCEDITKHGIEIDRLNLPSLTVYADEEGLALVLRNLLENALKFSQNKPKPHIEIGAMQDETTATLWVKDNGIGFDMKYIDRIFEIFQRLHRLEDYPGTGIGLALVKTAMQRMNGRVWAESEPGHGATFFLELKK